MGVAINCNAVFQVGQKINFTGQRLMEWYHTEFNKQKAETQIIQEKMNDLMRQPFSLKQYMKSRDYSMLSIVGCLHNKRNIGNKD